MPLRGRAQLPGLCSRDGGCGRGHGRSWPHQHGDSCEECSDRSVPHLALGGRSQHYDPGTPGESLGGRSRTLGAALRDHGRQILDPKGLSWTRGGASLGPRERQALEGGSLRPWCQAGHRDTGAQMRLFGPHLCQNRGALQAIDHLSLFRPLCKFCASVRRVCDIVPTLRAAMAAAQSGTPGRGLARAWTDPRAGSEDAEAQPLPSQALCLLSCPLTCCTHTSWSRGR